MNNQILNEEESFSATLSGLQKSPRKEAVLLGLLGGKSDKEIAESLEITEGTVRKQISLICETFGLQGSQSHSKRVELVALFAKYKPELLITPQFFSDRASAKEQVFLEEAPDVSSFYGRTKELETLQQWLIEDRCRLISVHGIGGIGKSALAAKLLSLKKIQDEFDCIIWRNLNENPSVEKVLEEIIKLLSNQQATGLNSLPLEGKIAQILHYLRSKRCLLILDNFESILQGGDAKQKDVSKSYIKLIKRVGESPHQSCLLITSRENPEEVAKQEGKGFLVHTLLLGGLNSKEACKILESKGISCSTSEVEQLVSLYGGNPLALKILATYINSLFSGKVTDFIASLKGVVTFAAMEGLLEEQFNRIDKFEKAIMYWLAINREKVSLLELQEDIKPSPNSSDLIDGLENLRRCSLIEIYDGSFTLQPIVMEYVTDRFVKEIVEEIKSKEFELFSSFALVKATAKDYIRESQIQLILMPISKNLASLSNIEEQLIESLKLLKKQPLKHLGYVAGNILNLLCYMGSDVSGCDFSGLPVWQAHLEGRELHGVAFTNSDLTNSVFTQTFGTVLTVTSSSETGFWAMGDTNNEIRLWKGCAQQILTYRGHTNWIRSVAFSPDGRTIASGSDDQTVRLWDVETAQCLNILKGHSERVWSVTFSSNGKIIASSGEDRVIRIWNIETGGCLNIFEGHTNWIRSVAFSPDGKTIASGSDDQTVRLWDVETAQCLNILKGHTGWVRSVIFSPDGEILASSGEDKTVKIWNVKTANCLNTLEGHSERVWSVTFSSGGHTISSSDDKTVEHTLISSSDDKTVRFWNITDGKCLRSLEGYTNWAWSVAFSPDGKTLISGSEDKTVRLWNVKDGSCLKLFQGHTNRIRSVAFNFDSKTIASGSDDRTVRLWNIETGQCFRILKGHSDRVLSVTFSPDGKVLASAGDDRIIKLWKVKTGQCIQTLKGHSNWIWSIAFSPDGQELASGSEDKTVKLWDIGTGQCLRTWEEHSSWVRSVTFSPHGEILASAGEDRTIRMWDVATGQCLKILQGHTNWIRSIAFCPPDGEILASAGQGKMVRLWNTKTGKCYDTLKDHSQRIWTVVFAPDGKSLASGSEDGIIRLWNLKNEIFENTVELRTPKLYEGMKILGVKGLTEAEISNLVTLGAEIND